jgi:signal transduction histidine kinase
LSDPQQVSAAARHERLLLRLLIFARIATLCQAAVSLGLTWRQLTEPLLAAALLGLLIAENIILIRGLRRRDGLGRQLLATLDVGLGMAALFAIMALLKHTAIPDTDNFLYPYTVASMSVIGLVYRRFPAVLLIPTLAAAGYLGATLVRFGPRTTVDLLTNVITYWAWAVASWFVAARFRKLSAELDQARDAAAAREAELARERECSRHQRELHVVQLTMAQRERERTMLSRDLHDHVLQTLEFMGREDWISDTRMRDHVAAEAVWLRELVHSELDRPVTGLTAALDGVVARQTGAGMRIEMNTAGLGTQTLPAEVVGALAGAVTELLTNVRKHAGTTRAVLRAVCSPDLVTVTVLDRGRGFAPIRATSGLGLRESVIARIRQVDGRVVVTSEPNAGTHVELTVPLGRTPAPVPGGPAEPAPSAASPPAAAEPPAVRPAFARSAPGGQRLVMQTQDMPAGAGRCENATTPGMRSLLGQQGYASTHAHRQELRAAGDDRGDRRCPISRAVSGSRSSTITPSRDTACRLSSPPSPVWRLCIRPTRSPPCRPGTRTPKSSSLTSTWAAADCRGQRSPTWQRAMPC